MKECTRCHQLKPAEQFYRERSQSSGLNPRCKVCVNEHNRAYHEANREAMNRWKRMSAVRRWAKKTMGITPEQLHAIELRANGRCELCGRSEETTSRKGTRYALAVDHDHLKGQVRALLCRPCNTALGCANDNPTLLRRMADYLENPPPLPEPVEIPRRVRNHSEETRAKIASAATGRPSRFKGVPRTPEVRAKISGTQKGATRSDEARANMRAARLRYLGKPEFPLQYT